ncbi:MAG: 5-bromo-4-chloroindolyl phosphate hydrolysis family protein [Pseudomonadota bacterium]
MVLTPLGRQVVAGTASALAFLGLYLALGLAWWLALGGAIAVQVAVLMLVEAREPGLPAGDGIDDEELRAAVNRLTEAASRLRAATLKARGPQKQTFRRMAELVEAIRGHHVADRRDFRHTRPFVNTTLGRMVASVEGYLELDSKARGANRERLEALSERIEGFVPVLERIDQACLENDFIALEVEVEVLGDQLARER